MTTWPTKAKNNISIDYYICNLNLPTPIATAHIKSSHFTSLSLICTSSLHCFRSFSSLSKNSTLVHPLIHFFFFVLFSQSLFHCQFKHESFTRRCNSPRILHGEFFLLKPVDPMENRALFQGARDMGSWLPSDLGELIRDPSALRWSQVRTNPFIWPPPCYHGTRGSILAQVVSHIRENILVLVRFDAPIGDNWPEHD